MDKTNVPKTRRFVRLEETISPRDRLPSPPPWKLLPYGERWRKEPQTPLTDLVGQTQRWLQERLLRFQPLIRPGARIFLFGTVLGLLSVLDNDEATTPPQIPSSSRSSTLPPLLLTKVRSEVCLPDAGALSPRPRSKARRSLSSPQKADDPRPSPLSASSLPSSAPTSASSRPSSKPTSAALAPPPPPATPRPLVKPTRRPRAILISWDGAKPSILQALLNEGQLPFLRQLANEGLASWKAQTIFPSKTLPSHTSMVTGLRPEKHGILWNTYLPWKGRVQAQTVFGYARLAGFQTGLIASKHKFRHLMKKGTLDVATIAWASALGVSQEVARVLQTNDLDLLMIHFNDPDIAGHLWGWGNAESRPPKPPSQAYLQALRDSDQATGQILALLRASERWKDTLVLVTSDHGGHERNHGSASWQDTDIPWVAGGGLLHNRCRLKKEIRTFDTPATLLGALGLSRPPSMEGTNVLLDCFR